MTTMRQPMIAMTKGAALTVACWSLKAETSLKAMTVNDGREYSLEARRAVDTRQQSCRLA